VPQTQASSSPSPLLPTEQITSQQITHQTTPSKPHIDFKFGAGSSDPPQVSPIQPCPAELVRLSVSAFPQTPQLEKEAGLPLGITFQPLAPLPTDLPLIDSSQIGVPRCRHCRAYINPYVTFVEGGRRWLCPFCRKNNDVANNYFSPVDHVTSKRADHSDRLELNYAAVEYLATSEYIVRAPPPPVFVFVIDVSLYASASGMISVVADAISKTLDYLISMNDTIKVAFVTCDDSVHFYAMRTSGQPVMMVKHDLETPTPPPGYEFLVNLQQYRKPIEQLLSRLPTMFSVAKSTQCCIGSGIQGAFNIQKAIGGKILVFSSIVPTIGCGKHPEGDFDNKLLGTPKEMQLIAPKNDFFKELGMECSKQQISVDVFCTCGANYNDMASLSALTQITGGQIFYYPKFHLETAGSKFGADIISVLTRKYGWESVMRVRASKGIKTNNYHGNLLVRSVDLMIFPVIDPEKAITLHFKLEEAFDVASYGENALFQAGLLYTNDQNERRIRVLTIAIPITSTLEKMYRDIDVSSLVCLISKISLGLALKQTMREAREYAVNTLIDILANYKKVSPQTGQLMIPPGCETLPMYILGLIKNITLRAAYQVHPDERVAWIDYLKTAPVEMTTLFLYPRLFRLHQLSEEHGVADESGNVGLPPLENLSIQNLTGGMFLLDNGQRLILWISSRIDPELLVQLFGTRNIESLPANHTLDYDESLPPDTYYNRVASIIGFLRSTRATYLRLYIAREGDVNHNTLFLPALIDDKVQNVFSYTEFIQQVQTAVAAKKV